MRRAARRDSNEAQIVAALRQLGASVVHLNDPGVPDLLVGIFGRTFLVEVKREKGGRLTQRQKGARAKWKGAPWRIVKTADDIATGEWR